MRNGKDKKKIIAVRSDSIIEARFTLSSKQNDILDMFFSQIKDDDKYEYEICVDKYKDLYNIDTSNLYRDLKKATKKLEGEGFRLINKDTDEEIFYPWFSKIHYKNKEGKILVKIDDELKKMLYEVKKKVYYDISYTLNFSSSYSQRMYYYLKSFEDTGWRKDTIDELQEKLDCPKTYKNFANFKKYVLEVAKSEINATSDILFDYEIEFEGRKAKYIFYKIKKKNSLEIDFKEVLIDLEKTKELNCNIISKLTQQSFSDNELERILNACKLGFSNQKEICGELKYENEIKYFINQLKKANDYYSKEQEGEFIAILISSLKNGWGLKSNYKKKSVEKHKPYIKSKQVSMFNDFEQREYNYADLETKFFGYTDKTS